MHHIQDLILTAGSLVFIVALIPTILGKQKPALATSLLNGGVLVLFSGVYVSLNLLFSSVITLGSAIGWFILAVQKYRQ